MGLELILKNGFLIKRPWIFFFISIFSSSLGILFARLMFSNSVSIVMIVFAIVPIIPLFAQLLDNQEQTLTELKHMEIKKIIFIQFLFLFIGLVFSYSLWFFFLPTEDANMVFQEQINSIYDLDGPFGFMILNDITSVSNYNEVNCENAGINYVPSEDFVFDNCYRSDYDKNNIDEIVLTSNGVPKYVVSEDNKIYTFNRFLVKHIFINNLWVMIFIYVTSFIFGAGSIFILTWNASIVGVFIGDALKRVFFENSGNKLLILLFETPKIVRPLLVHGTFEFAGFFSAAIAGGVLSVAFMKHSIKSKHFAVIFRDSAELFLAAVLFILIGAIIEIYL